MISRAGRRVLDPRPKAHHAEVEGVYQRVDHANRVLLVNVVIQPLWKYDCLRTVHPFDKSLHA